MPEVIDHEAAASRLAPAIRTQAGKQPEERHSSQFALLRERRFAPFFWTQFLGAANDNLHKFALTVLVTYQLSVAWLPADYAGLVIGALFILPFLLFSATSGQVADKYDKAMLIRRLKGVEIAVMGLAAVGFVMQNIPMLLATVFLMGAQSAVFGPLKYAYLPQHLGERELTGGNGVIEMGTFVAILLGNVAGGLLIAIPGIGRVSVASACIALAALGLVSACRIPVSPASDASIRINWNLFSETWRNLKIAHQDIVVFRSLLGISWMWFFGAVLLTQFPSFASGTLGGNEHVASLLLVVFSIGIGLGSLACEMLSRRHVEIGLVPLGAIGMTAFAVDLYLATAGLQREGHTEIGGFLSDLTNWRVMFDLFWLSFFTGLFSVPMYALVQIRSRPSHRARTIAANNVLNALFMIASSIFAGALLAAGLTISEVILVTGVLNAIVAGYIFYLVPEYLLRFIAWVASRLVYRFKVIGDDAIPSAGAAIIAANHVSFVDAILLMAASPRPIRFLMDHRIFRTPVLGAIFTLAGAIPVASRKEDPDAYDRAMKRASQVLMDGDLLGIFPEGAITRDGALQPFRPGILKILADAHARADASNVTTPDMTTPDMTTSDMTASDMTTPNVGAPDVLVVPVALQNLWGSYFSRIEGGTAMRRPFRRGIGTRVGIRVGAPMSGRSLTLPALEAAVASLAADAVI